MSRKPLDQEGTIREIRKQLNEQAQCFDFRTESKLSLLAEMRDFFKKRGEVELDYAKNLERLCERFEKSTKQRNIKNEVRSTFNLWSTQLAETRRMARDRASLAETIGLEMVARIDVMAKDVNFLAKKCKDMLVEVQETFFKDLKELSEQTKVYQYACHHSAEAHGKLVKCKEKVEATKNSAVRRKKAEEKEKERLRQYNEQKHRQLKCRNEYLIKVCGANSRVSQYFGSDIMDLVELMDYDYHDSFGRLAVAYHEAEQDACNQVTKVTTSIVDQTQALNFENDLHYFLSGFSNTFTQPPEFSYMPFGDDDVEEYKVNTKDVFLKAQESVKTLSEEVQMLKLQREGDGRTIDHVLKNNLQKYKVQTVDDAIGVLEEMGDAIPPETLGKAPSLERGSLVATTRGVQALHASQKGKDDTLTFTLGAKQRKLIRASQQRVLESVLEIIEKSLSEQKVPPVTIGSDYRVPKLFGGDCLEYIMATGCVIPLIIQSCCLAIEKEGTKGEGLFRVPGPAQQIDDLKKGFEEGRDPLMYSSLKGIEITAVASVLKLYFRELSNPLFPCEKYYDFINCTRREDPQERLELLRDTLNSLHPAVITVMRYLFKFLHRISLHAAETKMNSANLALVFGPTLTRAPADADPRLLHNDVPAINVLIQVCIERHEYLFGPDAEEDGLSSPPPPPEEPTDRSVTSPSANQQSYRRAGTPDSFTDTPPPPEENEDYSQGHFQYPPDYEHTTEVPVTEPVIPVEPVVPVQTEVPVMPVPTEVPTQQVPSDVPTIPVPSEVPVIPVPSDVPTVPVPSEVPVVPVHDVTEPADLAPPDIPSREDKPVYDIDPVDTPPSDTPLQAPVEDNQVGHNQIAVSTETSETKGEGEGVTDPSGADQLEPFGSREMTTQQSNVSINTFLDQAMLDISASIDSMKKQPVIQEDDVEQDQQPPVVEVVKPDPRRRDSKRGVDDDEDEGESDSDSEEVMTISAKALYDYNARNEKELSFIKGCVLEVIEKTPDGNWWDGYYEGKRGYIPVSYVEIAELQSVPVPPARKSSMQPKEDTAEGGSGGTIGGGLSSSAIKEDEIVETTPVGDDITPEVKTVSSIKKEDTVVSPPTTTPTSLETKPPKPSIKSGTVSKLTERFQSPTHTATPPPSTQQQSGRVLFNPHKRNPSADLTSGGGKGGPGSSSEGLNRSGSTGLKTKPPPPIRPKPEKEGSTNVGASPFPLMSHDTGASASPLQQAHLQQVVSQGPGIKKPAPIIKRGSRSSGSSKKKPDKPPVTSKPATAAKPGSVDLQAELAAATRKRKQDEETS